MGSFRKIKIFKFSDYENYEQCQESANDYYKEVAMSGYDCDLIMNVDYIAVILPKVSSMYRKREIPTTTKEQREEITTF